jgi:hypothetical protein
LQRKKIVAGEYEPTPEEDDFLLTHSPELLSEELTNKLHVADEADKQWAPSGIPLYWPNVLRGSVISRVIKVGHLTALAYFLVINKELTTIGDIADES